MKKLPLTLLSALALASAVHAQTTVSSDPVGFNSITALGNSDTRFSVPLHRPASYQGAVASISGSIVTVSGSPNFTASQFVYASGTQTNTYYVEFITGAKAGLSYTVTANDANTLTLNLNGDSLATVVAGDTFRVIPYWTLSTLFPNQTGVTGTSSLGGAGSCTRILLPDVTTAGIDLAAAASYYYYTGASAGGPGWRKQGGGVSNIKDNDVVAPDQFMIVRQDGVASDANLTATGVVPVTVTGSTVRKFVIGTLAAGTPQDNAVALDVPVGLTLSQSNLFQSGAFLGTTSLGGATGDKLLVYDDTLAATDKAASKTYYYYTGTSAGGAGWRLQGGGVSTIRDNEVVFQPGSGFIIRKDATVNPTTSIWTVNLSY